MQNTILNLQSHLNVAKGKRIIIKGVTEQNGNAWYKIEDWMYIDASAVSFRSKK
ncbi:TPA: hypothetical protein R8834_001503 [Campylobacter coli]|nr:hypothetical protein [Campylobacter coli]